MKLARSLSITLVCVILGIMIAWQYRSIDFIQKQSSIENKRESELKDDLLREKKKSEDMRKTLTELEKKNDEYKAASGKNDETSRLINKELEEVKIFAGLTDVKGKGVIITLENKGSMVYDDDILSIINELRASDAQAISVNNERIVSTSEVRVAGSYIMINDKQMIAPFIIKAIGDPEKVESSFKIIGGVLEKLEFAIKVKLEKADNIVINKVDSSILKYDLLLPAK